MEWNADDVVAVVVNVVIVQRRDFHSTHYPSGPGRAAASSVKRVQDERTDDSTRRWPFFFLSPTGVSLSTLLSAVSSCLDQLSLGHSTRLHSSEASRRASIIGSIVDRARFTSLTFPKFVSTPDIPISSREVNLTQKKLCTLRRAVDVFRFSERNCSDFEIKSPHFRMPSRL